MQYSKQFYDTFRPALDLVLSAKWNNNWIRSNVYYNPRGLSTVVINDIFNWDSTEQVRDELQPLANTFIDKYYDDRMLTILQWVHANIKYKEDIKQWNAVEYWQNAAQTLALRTGDCEDGAILLYKLARLSGVPAWRLKVCAGWVKDPADKTQKAGHAYCIYLSEEFNEWFILDWCYYYTESLQAYLETPHSQMPNYEEIWWTINDEYCWSQKDCLLTKEGAQTWLDN